jgi:hypothetical protein
LRQGQRGQRESGHFRLRLDFDHPANAARFTLRAGLDHAAGGMAFLHIHQTGAAGAVGLVGHGRRLRFGNVHRAARHQGGPGGGCRQLRKGQSYRHRVSLFIIPC